MHNMNVLTMKLNENTAHGLDVAMHLILIIKLHHSPSIHNEFIAAKEHLRIDVLVEYIKQIDKG